VYLLSGVRRSLLLSTFAYMVDDMNARILIPQACCAIITVALAYSAFLIRGCLKRLSRWRIVVCSSRVAEFSEEALFLELLVVRARLRYDSSSSFRRLKVMYRSPQAIMGLGRL
jgi:hypothetical protein